MSNIGKQPITIRPSSTISIQDEIVTVAGPKGTLTMKMPKGIELLIETDVVRVKKTSNDKSLSSFYGLARAIIANMVIGVTDGFSKKLELSGVGYRARVDGQDLVLNVGYSDPVKVKAPTGITFNVEEGVITVTGIDKQLVGDISRDIREIRVPDPYKAKGIKYMGEKIRRKVGKAAKAVGAK